jgi:hypothetical protein
MDAERASAPPNGNHVTISVELPAAAVEPPAAAQPPSKEHVTSHSAHTGAASAPAASQAVAAPAAGVVPAKPTRCCSWKGLPLSRVRAPLQMGSAMGIASALALAPQCAAAFRNKGVWIGASMCGRLGAHAHLLAARLSPHPTRSRYMLWLARHARLFADALWHAVITVTMALEPTVGATSRKATLRALGTAAGGVLAVIAVALTAAVNSGWAPGAPPGKVAAMTLLVATFGAGVQYARSKDPSRDYAYVVALVTLVIAALSEFTIGNWRSALISVLWRLATIAVGGGVAFAVSNVIAPEYASHSLRLMLAAILDDAAELLGGTVDAYVAEEDAGSDAGSPSTPRRLSLSLGGPSTPRRKSVSKGPSPPRRLRQSNMTLSLTRTAPGFNGVAGEGGGDEGLELEHAALHSVEARLSKALERLSTLAAHATEERRVRLGDGISVRRFAAAGTAARAVFTGAVSLLHGMESGLHLCGLCAIHAPHIRTARAEMAAAFAVAGRLATGAASVEEAEAALASFEAAVSALAADVTADVSWRRLIDADGGGEVADAALRHNVQALGAVCFALGDAARQLGRIVRQLDPDAAAKASKPRSSDESAHDGAMLSAPGGAAPASGGGSMGKALRGAAHALDAALHTHLAARHAPIQRLQTEPMRKGSRGK